MVDTNTSEGRISFGKGKQRKFIEAVQVKSEASIDMLARIIKVNPRTLRDWKKEKFLASYPAIWALSRYAHVPIPKTAKRRKAFWFIHKAALAGGKAVMKRYGRVPNNEENRKKKWMEWWNNGGKFRASKLLNQPLPFRKPSRTKELAEFFGIMIGDGGMSKYQLSITLHHTDDLLYSKYVIRLMKKLFGISPAVYHIPSSSVNNIVISRKNLVLYLHSLGLPVGDKMRAGLDIPSWIKNIRKYQVACMRGMVDTDGCVFNHRYKVNNKWYSYKKIDFTSASATLRESVSGILKDLGMTPSVYRRNIRLNSKQDVRKYFKLVGSHNPKHLKKYYN